MRPPDPPDCAARFERRLAAVGWRRAAADGLSAAAIGALAFAAVRGVLLLAGTSALVAPMAVAAACTAGTLLLARRGWGRGTAAQLLERAASGSHNVIVTAEELLRTGRSVPAVVRRVVRDADRAAASTSLHAAAPIRGRLAMFTASIVVAISIAGTGPRGVATPTGVDADPAGTIASGPAADASLRATVVPPAYLGLPEQRLLDPERIEAIAGSLLRLELRSAGATRMRFGTTALRVEVASGRATAEVRISDSGYVAIEGAAGESPRRLLPVVVTRDRAPTIAIEAPGKDLLVPAADTTIPVAVTATDDYGLRMLELRYTKVSGSGEQYAFDEGQLPLRIDRASAAAWRATGALALEALNLQPGDSLVYRVIGSDARPAGSGLASSDTFFVEVAGPGQVTLAGFELPPDRERHALSQQMILLKLQRLRTRAGGMAREAVAEESASIAAEQRAVRANFIFLTGGHVEDEEEEAAHSHEIQEGRLEHGARKEIGDAIAYMSRVEQALAETNPAGAIPPARAAVEALQRAFGRSRYLLRSLPVRSRLDPSRRLTGDRKDARGSERAIDDPERDPAANAAREILRVLTSIAARGPTAADSTPLSSLAERALSVDPSSADWQAIAGSLSAAADAARGQGTLPEGERPIAAALLRLQQQAARGSVPGRVADPRDRALRGAWAAAGGSR